MAHPKPSSRLLCQLKKGTRSAPLLDWGAIGGVGWGVKGDLCELFLYFRSTNVLVADRTSTNDFVGEISPKTSHKVVCATNISYKITCVAKLGVFVP
jgi:hypothetical protein